MQASAVATPLITQVNFQTASSVSVTIGRLKTIKTFKLLKMNTLLSKTLTLCLTLPALLLAGCDGKVTETVTLQGQTMGTTYAVKYLTDGKQDLPSPEKVQQQLDDLLKEVNRQMSTYQQDSEISRFNQMRDTRKPMAISPDFAYVTAEAIRLNKLTHGALDVTVGPLVNLWGFGPNKEVTYEPSPAEIAAASKVVGIDKILLNTDTQPPTLAKTQPEVYLDLSSIAKGFGVDKVAQHLENLGIRNYLVEIGGELHGKGRNSEGQPWRIGIEQPNIVQGSAAQIIMPLDNKSLATSGDYRIFHLDKQGRRLSHIINPQTKRPISHRLASVSVVADNATTADGLSTGLFVLGEQEALKLAEEKGLAIFMIIQTDKGYQTEMSSAFKQLLKQETP